MHGSPNSSNWKLLVDSLPLGIFLTQARHKKEPPGPIIDVRKAPLQTDDSLSAMSLETIEMTKKV